VLSRRKDCWVGKGCFYYTTQRSRQVDISWRELRCAQRILVIWQTWVFQIGCAGNRNKLKKTFSSQWERNKSVRKLKRTKNTRAKRCWHVDYIRDLVEGGWRCRAMTYHGSAAWQQTIKWLEVILKNELSQWEWFRFREVGDSSQSFSSDTLQGISSEWSGDTTELVYIQRRRDLIG